MSKPTPPAAPTKRPALGRGLSALIPMATSAPAGAAGHRGVLQVPVEEVTTDIDQPRQYWNLKALEELTASVKAKGIIQPILVRRLPEGGYRIIAGERRYRAAREAGLSELPVIVREVSETDAFEIALIENIQREDLNPVEEARAYQRLLTEHGLTQETMAQRVGKDRSSISNALRLLKLPPEVHEQLASGALTVGHAKVLLGLDDAEEQVRLTADVTAKGMSVRDLERVVQRKKAPPEPKRKDEPALPPKLQTLSRRVERLVKVPVEVRSRSGGAGEVLLHFASEEQAVDLLEMLVAALKAEGSER